MLVVVGFPLVFLLHTLVGAVMYYGVLLSDSPTSPLLLNTLVGAVMYYGVLLRDSPTAYSSDPRGGPQATERHTTVTAGTFKSFTTGTSGKRPQ